MSLNLKCSRMTPQINCVLCYRVCNIKNSKKSRFKTEKSNISLEEQVAVIFTLRKLLDVPKSFCEILLLQSGNPAGWITSCTTCSELLKNAHNVFKKLTALEKEYLRLTNKTKNILIQSKSKTDGILCNTTTDHIRNFIFSDLGKGSFFLKSKSAVVSEIVSDSIEEVEVDLVDDDVCQDSDDDDVCQDSNDDDGRLSAMSADLIVPTKLKTEPPPLSSKDEDYPENSVEDDIESDADSYFDTPLNPPLATSVDNNINSEEIIENYDKRKADPEINSCEICKKVFPRLAKLKLHLRGSHYKELNLKPFQCKECNVIYKDVRNLQIHMTMKHTKNYPEFCPICNAGFHQKSQVNQHVKNVHGEKQRLPCSICSKTFSNPRNLKFHISIKHTKKFAITCEICGFGSMGLTYHKRHMRTHNKGRKFTCELCGKNFKNEASFRDHRRGEHYQELNLEPFKCAVPDCGMYFKSRSGWLKHGVEKHTKKLNFPCPHCDRRFYANHYLQKHVVSYHKDESQRSKNVPNN